MSELMSQAQSTPTMNIQSVNQSFESDNEDNMHIREQNSMKMIPSETGTQEDEIDVSNGQGRTLNL